MEKKEMYKVVVFEESFGCSVLSVVVKGVDLASAKSIVRHYEKLTANIPYVCYSYMVEDSDQF